MDTKHFLHKLSGGTDIIEWFGRVPRFHDAELLQIELSSLQDSSMLIHAWNMTSALDSKGFYVTDRHALITISFTSIRLVELVDFHQRGIIFSLEFNKIGPNIEVSWTSSYGVDGRIEAEEIRLDIRPGKP